MAANAEKAVVWRTNTVILLWQDESGNPSESALTDQSCRLEVFDDGVLSDWQMELIPTQNEPVVDGVAHQVDAGSHDKSDDADVDRRARQRLRTALNQLMPGHDTFCTWYRNISLK